MIFTRSALSGSIAVSAAGGASAPSAGSNFVAFDGTGYPRTTAETALTGGIIVTDSLGAATNIRTICLSTTNGPDRHGLRTLHLGIRILKLNEATSPLQAFFGARSLITFVAIGPLIGALPFAALFVLFTLHYPSDRGAALVPLVLAYPIGLLPAAIAGLVFNAAGRHALRRPQPLTTRRLVGLGAAAGAVACTPFVLLLVLGVGFGSGLQVISTLLPIILCAKLAGAGCGFAVARHWAKARLKPAVD